MKKSNFKILIVLAFLITIVFVSVSPVSAAYYIVTQLTDNSYDDERPAINNGFVAWQGWDGNDWEVFLYDGENTTQITTNSYNDQTYDGPDVNKDGYVVWKGNPGEPGSGSEIFLYDGVNTTQITNDSYQDEIPKINDSGHIVWRGWSVDDTPHIFYYDGSTTRLISDICWSAGYELQINANGEVAWVAKPLDSIEDHIFFYDGISTKQITDSTYRIMTNSHPIINKDGNLVWSGWKGILKDDEIFIYNGSIISQITDNSSNDNSPDINDDGFVVWRRQAAVGYDILLYDGTDIVPIANIVGGSGDPKISNNGFIAWQGIDPNNSTDNKIFVYDGSTTIVLESNATNDRSHRFNANGDVVWQAHDGNDYEIFLATLIPTCNYDGICNTPENCSTCPDDCIGKTTGKPTLRYCCGDGVCENEENGFNCEVDCGPCDESETSCTDGIDNDCDGEVDCNDVDCSGDPACDCLAKGELCSSDEECCSNKCRGKPGESQCR